MNNLKELCQEMAANPNVMKFSDIAKAAGAGAAMTKSPQSPLLGAILGVSLEASKRALIMSEELLQQYSREENAVNEAETKKKTSKKGM